MKTRVITAVFAVLAACDRPEVWERSLDVGPSVALDRNVAWPVSGREEIALYRAADNTVSFEPLPDRPRLTVPSPDGRQLLVLDQGGGLTRLRFDDLGRVSSRDRYALGTLYGAVEATADGHYAVLHHGGTAGGSGETIRNPNEIAILDLTKPAGEKNPVRRTLRSFGAGPRALVISGEGEIGGERRRFGWALSDRYLAVFDLALPEAREVIVPLTLPGETREVVPTSVVPVPAADGEVPGALVRASGTDDLFLLSFDAEAPANEVPRPTLNALPGGPGVVDALPLLTPDGLRVFTVGGRHLAVIDPTTGARRAVELPMPGERLVPYRGPDGQSALVWASRAPTVAYARLDRLEKERGRALTSLTFEGSLVDLRPVPGKPAAIAVMPNRLVLLDFLAETATPFDLGGSVRGLYDQYYDEYGYPQPREEAQVVLTRDGRTAFAQVDGSRPSLVSIEIDTGLAGAVELSSAGRLLALPGAGRLVVDHGGITGEVSVLPLEPLSEESPEPVEHNGLFLTEVLDR